MKKLKTKKCNCQNVGENKCPAEKYMVFIAGSLFNEQERWMQDKITCLVEQAGYKTFLAQRDGFMLNDLVKEIMANNPQLTNEEATKIASKQISDFDLENVALSDAIVSNVNGIEPDSGTIVETSFAKFLGKAVVLFNDDIRTFSNTTLLNPLVANLATVPIVTNSCEIVPALNRAFDIIKLQKSKKMIKADKINEMERSKKKIEKKKQK